MSASPLSRHAGPIALSTGSLLVVAQLILVLTYDASDRIATLTDPAYLVGGIVYFVAFCALLVTLVAAYDRQAHAAGRLGLVGFIAAIVGTMFLAGDLWFESFAVPWLGDVAPDVLTHVGGLLMVGGFSSYVLFAVGWALFGLASLRARVFPVAVSAALLAGGVIGFLALLPPFGLPLGLAVTWLGVWLVRGPASEPRAAGALAPS